MKILIGAGPGAGTTTTRAGAWALTILGLGIEKTGRVVSSFFLARLLSKEEFGLFILILVTLITVAGVLGGGMSAAAASAVARAANGSKDEFVGAVASAMALPCCVGLVMIAIMVPGGYDWLARELFAARAAALPLLLLVPAVVLQTLAQSWEGILQGIRQFSIITSIRAWAAPIGLIAVVVGGIKYGLLGAVAMLCVTGGVSTLAIGYQVVALIRQCGLGFSAPSVRGIVSLGRLAVIISISNVTVAVSMWLAQVVLARRVGLVDVGLFGVGSQLRNLLALPAASLGLASLPFLAARRGRGDVDGFRQVATQYTVVVMALTGCLAILLIGGCREILGLCYGAPMGNGWLNADLLFLSLVILSPGFVMAYVVIALDEPKHGFVVNLLWSIVYLSSGWVLIGIWGYVGLGAATVLASLCQMPVSVAYLRSRRALDVRRSLSCFLSVCAGALIVLSFLHARDAYLRLAGGIWGALVGITGSWVLGFTQQERKQLLERGRACVHAAARWF